MKKPIILSISALGVSSICTQLIFLREFLNLFYGNELTISIFFGGWFLLTGSGAWLGKFISKNSSLLYALLTGQWFVAVLPVISVLLIRSARVLFFLPGEVIGLEQMVLFYLAVLAPYCLISGLLLTVFCGLYPLSGSEELGKVYFIDNLGDIAGGILFSLVFLLLFNNLQSLVLPGVLNLTAAGILVYHAYYKTGKKRFTFISISFLGLSVFGLAVFINPAINFYWLEPQFPFQNIIKSVESRYSRLTHNGRMT